MIVLTSNDNGHVRFPDRAGALQDGRATPSLVRELGDNYQRYHAYLAEEFAQTGIPAPEHFPDYESYWDAYVRAQAAVSAEAFLRNCYQYRRKGRALDSPVDTSVPLLDSAGRLVSFV